MSLLDLLFGKKKTIFDPVLGKITSERMRGDNPKKLHSWYSSYLIPNAPEESSIILEGNRMRPNANQLNEIKKILNNLDLLWDKVEGKLNNELESLSFSDKRKFTNWKSTFYLGAIHPLGKSAKPHFEICFDTIDGKSNGYMIFSYRNGALEELEICAPK